MSTVATLPLALRPPCGFTQLAMALAKHKGDFMAVAEDFAGDAAMTRVMKSAIDFGTTSDANWAAGLSDYSRLSGEFVTRLRPATIFGKLRGLRYVPAATRTLLELGSPLGGFVVEGAPSPIGSFVLDEANIAPAKCQSHIVITSELAKTGNPAALATLEALMIRSLAEALDRALIDPTRDGSDGTPASITAHATGTPSTGTSAAQVQSDLKGMVEKLIAAGSDLSMATFVLHPRTALALSLLENAAGQIAFPAMTAVGGSLLGLPAITSAGIPIDTGGDVYIVLADGRGILVADDSLAAVDVSRQASMQMLTDPQTGAASLVSLWQSNLIGLRCTRWINWKVADGALVALLEDVAL